MLSHSRMGAFVIDCKLRALTAGASWHRNDQLRRPPATGHRMLRRHRRTPPAVRRRRAAVAIERDHHHRDQARREFQNVPMSVIALGTRKLDQLNVSNFEDYTKQLPSVFQHVAIGRHTSVYMRGVASGRRRRQSLRLAAAGRHLSRRTAGHDDRRYPRHPHLRHRADREPRRVPRARFTVRPAKPARSASSPTSRNLAATYGRIDGEINSVDHGGIGGKWRGWSTCPCKDHRFPGDAFYQHDAGLSTMSLGHGTYFGADAR